MARVELITTPHGTCAIVELADAAVDDALAALPADEQQLASAMPPVRRRDLIAGRTAMHRALAEHAPEALTRAPILVDDRGAPAMPPGWLGSVSHKGTRAVALVTPAAHARVGVDIEVAAPPRADITRRILTPRERAQLASLDAGVTLRFSIKEAIYKAIDPFVRRYVGFTEVELDILDDGVALVTTELPFVIETTWREVGGFWLTTARALPR